MKRSQNYRFDQTLLIWLTFRKQIFTKKCDFVENKLVKIRCQLRLTCFKMAQYLDSYEYHFKKCPRSTSTCFTFRKVTLVLAARFWLAQTWCSLVSSCRLLGSFYHKFYSRVKHLGPMSYKDPWGGQNKAWEGFFKLVQ